MSIILKMTIIRGTKLKTYALCAKALKNTIFLIIAFLVKHLHKDLIKKLLCKISIYTLY